MADQLDGSSDRHLRFRMEVCQYMEAHQEDFAPFIDDAILSFDKYCKFLFNGILVGLIVRVGNYYSASEAVEQFQV